MKKSSSIKRLGLLLWVVSGFGILVPGCAAPGSAVTQVHIRGRMINARGEPVARQAVQLLLPASYGLAGLDARMGKPSRYGHKDQVVMVRTDPDGRIEHAFAETTYSIAFWLLPPLGPCPKKPPKPWVLLRTDRQTDDYWVLRMTDSGFEASVKVRGRSTLVKQSSHEPAAFSGNMYWQPNRNPRGYLVDFQMRLQCTHGRSCPKHNGHPGTQFQNDPQWYPESTVSPSRLVRGFAQFEGMCAIVRRKLSTGVTLLNDCS